MKRFLIFPLLVAATACNPVDRSDEQPLAPEVRTIDAQVVADSCLMHGEVVSSHNSRVVRRGFNYGNDTLRLEVASADTTNLFGAVTQPLEPGLYFMVAFATNGIGTTRGDTLYFVVP